MDLPALRARLTAERPEGEGYLHERVQDLYQLAQPLGQDPPPTPTTRAMEGGQDCVSVTILCRRVYTGKDKK